MWCSTKLNTRTTTVFIVCKWMKNLSNLFDQIMIADHTNLFLTHKDISYIFEMANPHLERVIQLLVYFK